MLERGTFVYRRYNRPSHGHDHLPGTAELAVGDMSNNTTHNFNPHAAKSRVEWLLFTKSSVIPCAWGVHRTFVSLSTAPAGAAPCGACAAHAVGDVEDDVEEGDVEPRVQVTAILCAVDRAVEAWLQLLGE